MTAERERLFRLIPEARAFEWVDDLTPVGWLAHVGSFGQAIAFAELFWPEFVEHEGCVLLARRFDPVSFRQWIEATGGDRRAVEAVLNHTHILDLFVHREPEPTREQVVHLGRVLRAMWGAKLRTEFPGRALVVSFSDEELPDLLDYEITVFQVPAETDSGAAPAPAA
ncbi:MAG TPA: hypothetical protein VGE74_17830 [Gemmata sp.]